MKMELLWNQKQLERPPNTQWRTNIKKFDVTLFLTTLEKIMTDLNSQEAFHKEAAVLSRLIYRMKSKFRNDKGLKNMCKVNRAMLNYLGLSLEKEYGNLKDFVERDGNYVSLPSKQMLQYVLIRTQSFAKLMIRIEETSRHAGHFLKTRMSLGHAWGIAIVAYCVISRIWILSRHLTKKSCAWYKGLYRFLEACQAVGSQWLPENQSLPNDIKKWLGLEWIDQPIPNVPSDQQLGASMFKLITIKESESDEELGMDYNFDQNDSADLRLDSKTKTGNVITSKGIVQNKYSYEPFSEEIGELLDRRRIETVTIKDDSEMDETSIKIERRKTTGNNYTAIKFDESKKEDVEHKNSLHSTKIKSKSDLMEYLNQESYPGLDKLQWNIIKNKSKKLLDTLSDEDNKTMSLKLRKIIRRIQRWVT